MLRSHAALRQCVRAASPATSRTPTRHVFHPPPAPCFAQQRTRTWFSRLLGTGFNSVRKSKRRTAPKQAKTSPIETTSPQRKPPHEDAEEAVQTSHVEPAKASSPPPASSQPHHEQRSYLRWSSKNDVNPESPAYVGTLYEYTVIKALQKYAFTLERCGGPNDQGIDLVGTWRLPSPRDDYKVLVQCKVGRPTPAVARELEGACSGGRLDWRDEHVMAWLASPRPATLEMWRTMQRSPRPMGFARISKAGVVIDMEFNDIAKTDRLAGLTKKAIYTFAKDGERNAARPTKTVALSVNGEPWPTGLSLQK